jgi:hypothetical protein
MEKVDAYIQGIGHNLQKVFYTRGGRDSRPGGKYHLVRGMIFQEVKNDVSRCGKKKANNGASLHKTQNKMIFAKYSRLITQRFRCLISVKSVVRIYWAYFFDYLN